MTLTQSRFAKFTLLIIGCVMYAIFYHCYTAHYNLLVTGCTLLIVLAVLMGLSVIRQMPFFSIFNARFWAQLHIYLGLFSLIVFILHVDRGWPQGAFNICLFVFFLLMIFTGLMGVLIYRRVPKKIMHFGEELVLSEIPARFVAIRDQAENVLKLAFAEENCEELKQFYLDHLYDVFKSPSQLARSMCGLRDEHQDVLLRELERLKRYADTAELYCIEQLQQLLQQKYDLDYYYAQKLLLRYWLYVHIPIAYLLIIFVIIHIIIVALNFY